MDLISIPGNVRVTSSPSFRVQLGAIVAVVAMILLGLFVPTGERLVCDERGDCRLRQETLFRSHTRHLGSADRIVGVDHHTYTTRRYEHGQRRRHTNWTLILREPEETISVERATAVSVDDWLGNRATHEGGPPSPKALPFVTSWHVAGVTIGLIVLVCVAFAVVMLRSLVRYEIALRGTEMTRRVTRVFVWTKESVISAPFSLSVRHFELLPSRRWRHNQRVWGVWCETTPGAGYWIAAGLTELEAATVVETLSSSPPTSLYPSLG